MNRFKAGDMAVHPMHGAGTVEEIQQRRIDGEQREYYVLRLAADDMRIMVPVATAEEIGLRSIISRREALELLEELPMLEVEMDLNWNKRYRENMEHIRSGNVRLVAAVARGLAVRDALRRLSTGERKMLNSTKQILASELVLALGVTPDEARSRLDERLAI